MTPEFILELRKYVGTRQLWLPGCTVVVTSGGGDEMEVLLVKRADNGEWTPVTGIIDPGEEPDTAAMRETKEETGLDIRLEKLVWVRTVGPVTYDNGDESLYLDHAFLATLAPGNGAAYPADGENSEVRWFKLADLPEMSPRFTSLIDHCKLVMAGEVETVRFGAEREV
ncbi:NUDIX hydrolase [Corynebacterium ulceribovis]|uniref:NUDIX hydrolase n=1 Tax=Corynebacterium ulceribovis TaxID=487732 RepID=UPI00037E2912|nr:NUDIX domain-containing protein [Corynebacterium ulceribovis]